MFLYEAIYHGASGRDDDSDIIYLVRAPDFRTAIVTVSRYASPRDHAGHSAPVIPHLLYQVGKDLAECPQTEPLVIRGPYFQCAYNYCWRRWERLINDAGAYTDQWEEKAYLATGA